MSTTRVLAFFDARFCSTGPLWEAAGRPNHWRHCLEPRSLHATHPLIQTPSSLGAYDLAQPDQAAAVVAAARGAGLGGFVLDLLPWNGGYVCGAEMLDSHCDDDFALAFQWDNGDLGGDWQRLHHACAAVVAALRPWRHAPLAGCPVLIIRRPHGVPDPALVVAMLRREAISQGLPGLYVIANAAECRGSIADAGFDALLDPDPAEWVSCDRASRADGYALLQAMAGQGDAALLRDQVLEYQVFSASRMVNRNVRGKVLPRVLPAFSDWPDHSDGGAVVLMNATPAAYSMFLRKALAVVEHLFPAGERAVFVDSWNDWRRRSQLEPTTRLGDSLLRDTRDAIAWGRYLARTQVPHIKQAEVPLSDGHRVAITTLCARLAADLEGEA